METLNVEAFENGKVRGRNRMRSSMGIVFSIHGRKLCPFHRYSSLGRPNGQARRCKQTPTTSYAA